MKSFIDFFDEELRPLLREGVRITVRNDSEDSNNLGYLEGVDLDSEEYSGYIYYWSKGFLDFSVFNIRGQKQEISTRIIETKNFRQNVEQVMKVLSFFK